MKSTVFSLLICALIAFAVANEQTIRIELSSESNSNWIAISVQNANVDTSSVQVKEALSDSWVEMEQADDYWTFAPSASVQFPLSFRLTSLNGDKFTVTNAIRSVVDSVDTGKQYSSIEPRNGHNGNSHSSHTTTQAPKKHTSTSTAAPVKHTTTTTIAPSKHTSTSTKAATSSTTKSASTTTTKAATSSSGSTDGCSAPMKLLVPLYTYPGSTWDTVAAGGSSVHTVAIINPNSGPGNGPDSSYNSYMAKLHTAGVEMIGYVHTSYGARSLADVKADIDVYASQFPLLVGIFLDESSASASQVSYYTQLYTYIMSFPGWKYDVLNPGAVPTSGYLAAATQIVTYESATSGFASSENPSFASCSNKDKFSMITYAASSASAMESAISAAKTKEYYGWVYVTSTSASGGTYNSLPSYYSTMVSYIATTIN